MWLSIQSNRNPEGLINSATKSFKCESIEFECEHFPHSRRIRWKLNAIRWQNFRKSKHSIVNVDDYDDCYCVCMVDGCIVFPVICGFFPSRLRLSLINSNETKVYFVYLKITTISDQWPMIQWNRIINIACASEWRVKCASPS